MILLEILIGILASSFDLLAAMAPYLLFGFLFAGILREFISAESIARHLGRSSFASVIKAALFGIPLPLCSCGVIPPTMALRKHGASRGAVLSFLIATPTSGVDSIFATYSLLGPFFAIYRVLASFVAGIFSGLTANLFDDDSSTPVENNSTDADQARKSSGLWQKARGVVDYAFIELLGEIGKWLAIGILIGGIITYAIPDRFFSDSLVFGWRAILLMLMVSVPVYVCATGSIPIAAALMLKGLNPGAAFVFLLAGPATNAVTMTVITRYLGKKTASIYVATLVISSVTFGLLLDFLWSSLGLSLSLQVHEHGMVPMWLQVASAALLLLLLSYHFGKNFKTPFSKKVLFKKEDEANMMTLLKVPDMSCNHCVMSIEKALKSVQGVSNVVVDLKEKKVSVEHPDELDRQVIVGAIQSAGYSVVEN